MFCGESLIFIKKMTTTVKTSVTITTTSYSNRDTNIITITRKAATAIMTVETTTMVTSSSKC